VRKEVQLHTDEKRKERKGNRDVDDREMVECVTGYLSVDVLTRIVEVQTNSLLTSLATMLNYIIKLCICSFIYLIHSIA
jgi:hypothetical protein